MSPVIRITPEVYSRLEKHAVGFDSPANVIEKLLNHYEKKENNPENKLVNSSLETSNARLFTNKEIQQKISQVASKLSTQELEELCKETSSKEIFGLSFPLLLKISSKASEESKRAAVKTEDGVSRWTWKYHFEKEGYLYAICTQWYPKNDKAVKNWLHKYEA